MAYKQLPMKEVALDLLLLDLENYRIPTKPDDESAALNYLFAEEDVLGAAKQLLRDGYFDNEVPIVTKKGRKYVVLEGNRRVSALKALRKPTIVPDHQREVENLLKRYAVEAENLPDTIRVLIAPTRAVANPHIARLHTTVPKKRWSRDQQANYYFSLLGPGTDVDALKAAYPDVDVVRFIKMVVMRRFLSGVAYTDPSLVDYVKSAALTMSAFEYAYRNADIAAALGASFDADGHLQPTSKSPEAVGADLGERERSAVEYLMTEFRANRLNTRSKEFTKKSDEHQDLLDRLAGVVLVDDPAPEPPSGEPPAPGGGGPAGPAPAPPGGNPTPAPGGTPPTGAPSPGGPTTPTGGGRGPNHPNTKAYLSLSGVDYTTHTSENLQLRYHELRKVNLKDTPVAAAMLLRSVLETTIKFHFEGSATPATGQLADSFKVAMSAYGKEKPIQHSMNRVQSAQSSTAGSIAWFNLVCHSADMVIDHKDVRAAYRLVEPILRRLLLPHAP